MIAGPITVGSERIEVWVHFNSSDSAVIGPEKEVSIRPPASTLINAPYLTPCLPSGSPSFPTSTSSPASLPPYRFQAHSKAYHFSQSTEKAIGLRGSAASAARTSFPKALVRPCPSGHNFSSSLSPCIWFSPKRDAFCMQPDRPVARHGLANSDRQGKIRWIRSAMLR
jgi:hypothetical protein